MHRSSKWFLHKNPICTSPLSHGVICPTRFILLDLLARMQRLRISSLCNLLQFPIFFKRFIIQTVYTRCTRMNCKIVPVTNSNRYVQYGANGKGVVEIQM